MSMFRALVNMAGNGIATLVVARWEKEVDAKTLSRNLASPQPLGAVPQPVKVGQSAV
jgi:aerobic C4-dicarboxylate transport protein